MKKRYLNTNKEDWQKFSDGEGYYIGDKFIPHKREFLEGWSPDQIFWAIIVGFLGFILLCVLFAA